MKDKIEYRVYSGGFGPSMNVYYSVKPNTLKRAREVKKEAISTNYHQGGGYAIVKITTSYKEIK